MGPDRRFRDPSPEEINALTLEGMREAVMAQLVAGNIEVRAALGHAGRWLMPWHPALCLASLGGAGPSGQPLSWANQVPQVETLATIQLLLIPAAQVCVVGDFDPAELEECCVKYLGTITPRQVPAVVDRPLEVSAKHAALLCGPAPPVLAQASLPWVGEGGCLPEQASPVTEDCGVEVVLADE